MRQKLELDAIRKVLIRREDGIIYNLFSRSEFAHNPVIYVPGAIRIDGERISLLDYLFRGREALDASAGRYEDPREHPFFELHLPQTVKRRTPRKKDIASVDINRNPQIRDMYLRALADICRSGDDNEYGSAALCDIASMQEISFRVHFGEYVAESKWRKDWHALTPAIKAEDWGAVEEMLRDRAVENAVLDRVADKGSRYGIDPEFIATFYREGIIPLTIDVEVEYIQKRWQKHGEKIEL